MGTILVTVRSPNRQPFTLLLDQRLEFGREGQGIIVADPQISRRHVALQPGPDDDSVLVTDLDSSNGTRVDDVVLVAPTRAARGSVVQIGDSRLEIEASPMTASVQRTELAREHPHRQPTSIDVVADAVERLPSAEILGVEDEPDTLTIVFSDIESSTELAVALGDKAWLDLLRRHHELVSAHVAAHRGRIVKNQGDGYMLCFRSARSAILAAIGIQRDLTRHGEAFPDQTTRVRMGLHTGEVLAGDDGDLFGQHVVVAARIGALADGAEILISSLVRQIVEPRGDLVFISPRDVELRGLGVIETVHAVDWHAFPGKEGP
jgi:class 3 adenylate cyclase